jgi:3-hydroxyacyl-CoA dehydrogenase
MTILKKKTTKKYIAVVGVGTLGFATLAFIKWSSIPIIIWSVSSAVIGNAMSNAHKMAEADALMREFAEWVASKRNGVEG